MAIHGEAPLSRRLDWLLPNTNIVTDSAIILPLFHAMIEEEQDWVIECLEAIGHHRRFSSPIVNRT
jgi:perosamine synthetase